MSTNSLSGQRYWLMDGLGNDFVIADLRRGGRMTGEAARALGDREGPFGCDQIITLEEGDGLPRMGIWNADGSEAGACGNAARCIAWLLMEEDGEAAVAFGTPSGVLMAERIGSTRVAVDMGPPRLSWEEIPLAEAHEDTRYVNVKLGPIDAPVLWGPSAVSMGNPHCVFFVDDVETQKLDRFGPLVEHHPMFPEGVNVSVAQVRSRHDLRVRTWERGVGLTKACGTAACAALVSAARRRLTGRKATVELDGGTLGIEWREEDDRVIMAGPVRLNGQGVF
ncbi:diaminopimelate epimerase [Parvularcula oceani]|uniref:diaminopimelate epimerase n=1 Tax=Parvularcula oceani TaxID=1247963 RepID=UPI00068A840E|nr:diaminopimelate epimerase [Parvularcula oceani]